MNVGGYLDEIRKLSQSGQATEHSYRPALERLFQSIDANLTVINEPKRLTDVGAPDFVFNRNGVSVGWCEAKDLTKEITEFKSGDYSKEQKARYAKGLPNLIYTNGTDFEFIVKGEVTGFVSIADLIPTLPARPAEFPRLEMLLKDFASQTPISVNTAKQLAEMMAGKAVIIKDIMGNALVADKKAGISTELTDQYEGFKISLIHDITIADFADIYAETIAYGLFAARLHDSSLDSFNRAEALELLPKSNPFLRSLFVYIAGPDLDDRLRRMIDDLCDVFRACDVGALMQDFGKFTAQNDPFLHFYETFLAAYNPVKRKARGVWYTPEPVVNFIVRAVDDVLKAEFALPLGLADTSKVSIDWDSGQNDAKGRPVMVKKEVHRVQILDPATGTGTFLAEAIKQIASQVNDVAQGMWSSYVERDLIPRLHGFELLMASYAMCHMKVDMMLTELGYKPTATPPRLGVYLTNSLEEGERVEQTLPFARWLSEEAKGANTIKRDTPIMCVIGNPPYAISSSNNGTWITSLIDDYKTGLQEQNIQALSDDYLKFIRFAQHLIEKTGEGIIGFVTNNSYIDGLIHRGVRKSLLNSFSSIYIFDLHGSTKRRERAPDGSPDRNVFDIQQGVAIAIFVKRQAQQGPCKVYQSGMFGSREAKYSYLFEGKLSDKQFVQIEPASPGYYLVEKNFDQKDQYNEGFLITDLMAENATGVKFRKDSLLVSSHFDKNSVSEMIADMQSTESHLILSKYGFNETADWKIFHQRANFQEVNSSDIRRVCYRPFDARFTYYPHEKINRIIPRGDSRRGLMSHLVAEDNFCLITGRQGQVVGDMSWNLAFVGSSLIDQNVFYRGGGLVAPLYLHPEPLLSQDRKGQIGMEYTMESKRRINFDQKIYTKIQELAGITSADGNELLVFDYIYGVLYSPNYRDYYKQFLKIGFPRIPYPSSPEEFAHVAEKGGQLRRLHLMQNSAIGAAPYPFIGEGSNVVARPSLSDDGRVMINSDQGFVGVPRVAWDFHIGGYQPAQKWLKDRKGRALSFEDVMHYQTIIKVLSETDRIMNEIELQFE